MDTAQEYRTKLLQLQADRAAAGGALPTAEEVRRTVELDVLWNRMTVPEQVEAEEWAGPRDAPKGLGLVDVDVRLGESRPPRQPG